jgi:hypothetical protein
MGRFCGDFRRDRSALSVSGDPCGLSGRLEPPVSAPKNSVPDGKVPTANTRPATREYWKSSWAKSAVFEPGP